MITRLHAGADATLRMLENISAAIAGCAALIAMVLVSADAVLRHLLAHPLTFQLYLTENYLLVAMILLALSWGYRTGGLVRITGLVEKLPEPLRPVVSRLGLAASALLMGYLAWLGGLAFIDAFRSSEVEMGVVDWPVAWSKFFVPAGTGLLAARLFLDALAATPFRDAGHESARTEELK